MKNFQTRIWDNKVAKGFSTTDVAKEICLLQCELVEFRDAERAGDGAAKADELADVTIFAYAAAAMAQVAVVDLPLHKAEEMRSPEAHEMSKAIANFFNAWQHGHLNAIGETVKVLIWNCEALAYEHGIDLARAVEAKLTRNEKRRYTATAHGHVKVGEV